MSYTLENEHGIPQPGNDFQVATVPAFPPSLSERLIVRLLQNLPKGILKMELPGGRRHTLGTASPEDDQPAVDGHHAGILVLRQRFFSRCVLYGDLGFAEAYVDGDWDSDDITAVLRWFISNVEHAPTLSGSMKRSPFVNLLRLLNRLQFLMHPNSLCKSRQNIREHYDLSNQFFSTFLDDGMSYSSALWRRPEADLVQAQEAKYHRLCRVLQLHSQDHLLEIGCGWGGFAEYAASHFGCRVTAVTISVAQYDYARRRIAAKGLTDRVEIQLRDYREIRGRFDKIASIEMIEAVGHRYLPVFFNHCNRLLNPEGLLGMQFITCPDVRYNAVRKGVDFIQKHIFPGGLVLSLNRVNALLQDAGGFQLHDLKDMGLDYARTLRAWRKRFETGSESIRKLGFDTAFIRKWRYYFCYCEAAFAERNISVVQTVHTRANNRRLTNTSPFSQIPVSL